MQGYPSIVLPNINFLLSRKLLAIRNQKEAMKQFKVHIDAFISRATHERMTMRLKYPTFALAYRTQNIRHQSSKDSNSGKTNATERVGYTAANGSGLDSAGQPPVAKIRSGQLPPNYGSTARRVTFAIVALPIAIVTSYVLFQRLVLGQEQKRLVPRPQEPPLDKSQ